MKQKGSFSSFIIKLAIVATALSVAVMITSVCIIGGFKSVIRDKIYSFWGHVLVVPYNENPGNIIAPDPIKASPELEQKIRSYQGVRQLSRFIVRPAIVQGKGQMEGIKLKGIGPDYRWSPSLNLHGRAIGFSDTDYARQIVISQTTADKLSLHAGDSVFIYFLESGSALPRIRKLAISGIYHTGFDDVDRYLGVVDIRLLQRINNWSPDQINGYQVELQDESYSESVSDKIFKGSELNTQTIADTFPGIMDWLGVQDLSVRILLIIMAIVATISMGAALLILIVERATITGLLKALGLNNSGTQKIFLYIALLTGGMGVLLGNVLALGLCIAQQHFGFLKMDEATYFMDRVPVRIQIPYIIAVDVATLVITVICMLIPTIYVRRMQPARVLQFK
ncbi:ABC transporter permease [Rurimicrobium arvi]|uniref:ABC transporter permease n=1 Tax=Rurimicrobium arvi TaxID=2049916 RepID=A0ABP8MEQ5_9BACT